LPAPENLPAASVGRAADAAPYASDPRSDAARAYARRVLFFSARREHASTSARPACSNDPVSRFTIAGGGAGQQPHPAPPTALERGGITMKLYIHPVSTTSRIVMLGAEECGAKCDLQVVDLMTGEHMKPPYSDMNPNKLVPMLEDGDFRLTESSAILKYLAEKCKSPAYPTDLRARARVNEMMDWFNSNIYKDLAYGLVYPQIFPTHQRPSEALQKGTLAWHKERTEHWLKILDEKLIGPKKAYLTGDAITIADYQGGEMIGLGDIIRCDYSKYPNISRWMGKIKALPSWPKVNEVFYGFAASVKDKSFVAV
jgi:glutathione S-transferase